MALEQNITFQQLLNDGTIYNWVAITFLPAFGFSLYKFIGSFFTEKGKRFATKNDFSELLNELKKTTSETQKIKTAISHSDWALKELKLIRRVKLEELMLYLYEADDWIESYKNHYIFDDKQQSSQSPIIKVRLIANLYFSELSNEVTQLETFYRNYKIWVLDKHKQLTPIKTALEQNPTVTNLANRQVFYDEMVLENKEHFINLSLALSSIEIKANELMVDILKIPSAI